MVGFTLVSALSNYIAKMYFFNQVAECIARVLK